MTWGSTELKGGRLWRRLAQHQDEFERLAQRVALLMSAPIVRLIVPVLTPKVLAVRVRMRIRCMGMVVPRVHHGVCCRQGTHAKRGAQRHQHQQPTPRSPAFELGC